MVNESCRPEPELSAAFACGIHHAEVIDSRPQHGTVSRTQLCYAAQQDLHPLSYKPAQEQFRHHIFSCKKQHHTGRSAAAVAARDAAACEYQCLVEVILAPLVSEEYLSQDSILTPLSNRKALR